MTMPRYCHALLHPQAAPVQQVGQKAFHLMQLARAGLSVPWGFVVGADAFVAFLARGGLGARIDAAQAALNWRDLPAVEAHARMIAAWVMAAPLPVGLWPQVRLRCREMPSPHGWAVRSSAVGEDSHAASFAGQLDSCLSVRRETALTTSLRRVWASYWSARALHYQRGRGIRLRGMAVLFQHMVQPTLSGVLFTRAPQGSGAAGEMLAEYCSGVGEKLVSGQINPARLMLDRARGTVTYLAPLPRDEGPDLLADPAVVHALWEGAHAVERTVGAAQDIEWVLDAQARWHVVQARPIAAPQSRAAPAAAPVVWSNANVNENYPEPMTPLLYSIARRSYEHYFRNIACALGVRRGRVAAMEPALRAIIGAHAGRMYYNLSSLHAVLGAVPHGSVWVRYFNQFVGAHGVGCVAKTHRFEHVTDVFELGSMATHGARLLVQMPRRVRAFERRISTYVQAYDDACAQPADPATLLGLWRGFATIRNHRWLDASLADAAAMLSYGALKSWLAGHCPEGAEGLHNTLLKGSADLVSSQPTFALWKLGQTIRADAALRTLFDGADAALIWARLQDDAAYAPFAAQVHDYLHRWGFRCSGELLLTVPALDERPEALVDLLKAYVSHKTESPELRIARQTAEARLALSGLRRHLRGKPWRYRAIAGMARLSQAAVAWRERVRLQQARLYHTLRRLALRVGAYFVRQGWLDAPDAIFFMRFEEVDAQLSGHAMLPQHNRAEVRARREAWADLARVTPEAAFTLPWGAYLDLTRRRGAAQHPPSDDMRGAIGGIGACGGYITGRAAVLHQVTDAARLRPDDILVTGQTDPGWAPIFPLISGLVIERGGMLSHGAIVAREFGIPAVVDARQATTRIAHGSQLSLDGDTGRVQWTEGAP